MKAQTVGTTATKTWQVSTRYTIPIDAPADWPEERVREAVGAAFEDFGDLGSAVAGTGIEPADLIEFDLYS